MRATGWFNLSALVASLMVLAIAFVLVPDKTWSVAVITSVVFFAFSIAFVFFLPSVILGNSGGNNAAQMISLGPLSFITGGMLLLTSAGFVSALAGWDKIAWTINIFAFGSFLISLFMLRASFAVIGNAAFQYPVPSKHILWQNEIQGLCGMTTDTSTKSELKQLAEKLRFAASDIPGGSPQDNQISSEIQALADLLKSNSPVVLQRNISNIEMLVEQRDGYLRTNRNKV